MVVMKKKSFKDSIKALETDIQHANTFWFDFDYFLYRLIDGKCVMEGLCSRKNCLCYALIPVLMCIIAMLMNDCYEFARDIECFEETCRDYAGGIRYRCLSDEASEYPMEYDGACLQMRLSYSHTSHLFLFLVQWTDCHLAGALGLLKILIYKAYVDGKTTMYTHERKASIREFYGVIFPSLLQLKSGITDLEEKKQEEICTAKYMRKTDMDKGKLSEIDIEREEECGICMEITGKVVLPTCYHSLCLKCYRDWRTRSQYCPFCRESLKRVNSGELWIYTSSCEIADTYSISIDNLKRLFMYIDKLPLMFPDTRSMAYVDFR